MSDLNIVTAILDHLPASEAPELMTQEEYLKTDGLQCPRCRSEKIVGDDTTFSGNKVWRDVTCRHCGFEYQDEYILTGYDPTV